MNLINDKCLEITCLRSLPHSIVVHGSMYPLCIDLDLVTGDSTINQPHLCNLTPTTDCLEVGSFRTILTMTMTENNTLAPTLPWLQICRVVSMLRKHKSVSFSSKEALPDATLYCVKVQDTSITGGSKSILVNLTNLWIPFLSLGNYLYDWTSWWSTFFVQYLNHSQAELVYHSYYACYPKWVIVSPALTLCKYTWDKSIYFHIS